MAASIYFRYVYKNRRSDVWYWGSWGYFINIFTIKTRADAQRGASNFYFVQSDRIITAFGCFFGGFYLFGLHSLWSSALGASVGAAFAFAKKPRFLIPAIQTGIIVCILFLPMYLLALYVNPEYIANEWLLHELSGFTIFAIPIEEFIWYMFAVIGVTAFQELIAHSVDEVKFGSK